MFKDRRDAGQQLAKLLQKHKGKDVVVYGLPRGGVIVADEIAKTLQAPLDVILAHKIGHPYHAEYAIGAISEHGHMIGNPHEIQSVNKEWLKQESERQLEEIKRRRQLYLKGKSEVPVKDKISIIVDDGIATGLTMQVGILDLKDRQPKKIVAAIPVAPRSTVERLKEMADEVVAVIAPLDYEFMGAVGAYYDDFSQTEDDEVIKILNKKGVAA